MPLEPAVELEHHARVELDGDDCLHSCLEEALRKITRPGPDLEDCVSGLEACLGNDGVHQSRIPQDVLPLGLLERDAALQPRTAATSGGPRAVALLLYLASRHCGGFLASTRPPEKGEVVVGTGEGWSMGGVRHVVSRDCERARNGAERRLGFCRSGVRIGLVMN